MFDVPELENVNIKLRWWFLSMDWMYRKKYYKLFTDMLSGLGNAKSLTLDLDSIEEVADSQSQQVNVGGKVAGRACYRWRFNGPCHGSTAYACRFSNVAGSGGSGGPVRAGSGS
ncbi:hypothetical protein POM88_002556 [Heracleum sosnowskyi]|uniref:Uncharacterized protein n=1 Tax=Heracleum sosnowskyi TaxID=360622 RepID=A0AAD8JFW8_9APIA|nr:hypothetical protein POM88_002556 [Heracleum sosnowskyi]